MTVQKNSDQDQNQDQSLRPEPANLVRRYGQIGIAALAAVLQYSTKKPSHTEKSTRVDERFFERTA